MGEEFNTEQFIQNLWERENLQGLKQVNGKGGYRNGRYFPYQGTNGIDIGPGFLLNPNRSLENFAFFLSMNRIEKAYCVSIQMLLRWYNLL